MLGGAVVAALILGGGWFFAISPQLSAASSTRIEADSARMQNVVLQAKNVKLKKDNEQAGTLRASLAVALAQLPSDGGLPAFTRQLSAQATADKVLLSSITVGGAAAVTGAAPATGSAVETSAAPVETPAAGSSAAAVPGAAAASATSIVAIPITLSASGIGRNTMAFLKDIQVTGPRRALVTASQLSPVGGKGGLGSIDGPCTLNLTLTVFSAPLTPTAKVALEKLISGK